MPAHFRRECRKLAFLTCEAKERPSAGENKAERAIPEGHPYISRRVNSEFQSANSHRERVFSGSTFFRVQLFFDTNLVWKPVHFRTRKNWPSHLFFGAQWPLGDLCKCWRYEIVLSPKNTIIEFIKYCVPCYPARLFRKTSRAN